jgi:succinylglutamate desuccinylase
MKIIIFTYSFLIITLLLIACGIKYTFTPIGHDIHNGLQKYNDVKRIELLSQTDYQAPAFIFDSGYPCSKIMILGGTHGNEPAGYEAALRLVDKFYKNPPRKGIVIIIPEANRQSVLNYDRRIPVPDSVEREKGNLNRCYPGDQNGLPMQQLAFEIQKLAIEYEVKIFIDLHEAIDYHLDIEETADQKGLGQTIIYSPNEPSTWILMNLLDKINSEIQDSNKKFAALERPILNSAAWWAGKYLGIAAFTFETSRKDPIEERIQYHLQLVDIVLELEGFL